MPEDPFGTRLDARRQEYHSKAGRDSNASRTRGARGTAQAHEIGVRSWGLVRRTGDSANSLDTGKAEPVLFSPDREISTPDQSKSAQGPKILEYITPDPLREQIVGSTVAQNHGQRYITAVRLTFVSLRRGERSLSVSSSRRVVSAPSRKRALFSLTSEHIPHHGGTRPKSIAPDETCAILGHGLHRLWAIPLFHRIRKWAVPFTMQFHHAHKIRIGGISMAWIGTRKGMSDARSHWAIIGRAV